MARSPRPWYWKRRKAWYVTIAGHRHCLGSDRKQAHKTFHELMTQSQSVRVTSDSVVYIFDQYLEWLHNNRAESTYLWYLNILQSFASAIPNGITTTQLKPHHAQKWIDQSSTSSDSTKRGKVVALKRVFNWAVKLGLINTNPLANLEKPPEGRRNVVITDEDYKLILKNCSDNCFKDLLKVAWDTGARPQEILAMEARHVELELSRIVFPKEESKNKRKPRIVYLGEPSERIVRKQLVDISDGPLLRNSQGKPWNKTSINSRFRRLAKKTGMKFCLYNFRHSFATRKLQAGLDPLTVAELLGHSDPSMLTRVYQHLSHDPEHMLNKLRSTS